MTGNSELRAVRPEAIVTLDGKDYPVGGLDGQPVQNYFTTEFLHEMKACDTAFVCTGYEIGKTIERFPYRPHEEWVANKYSWPAPGKRIVFTYQPASKIADKLKGITVKVIYELYDKAPILSKQIEVENGGTQPVVLNAFKSEILALTETAPKVHYGEPHEVRMMAQEAGTYTKDYRRKAVQTDAPRDYIDRFTQLFVVTDYAMGGDMEAMKDNPAVRWVFDHPEYEATGIRYYGQYKPARMEVTPLIGPDYEITPGQTFQSCTAFEMLRDATDTERRGLAECRFWRMMAPWTQENPIFMHVRRSDEASVKAAIDQCAAVGFEMVIMTFRSGFNIENDSPKYLNMMKRIRDYAADKGITIGGYSLLASRGAKAEYAAIIFVPLTQYHGGGARATIEPLHEHLDHYQRRLQNLFGAGVQACHRGPRLYDTDSTRLLVTRWVDFYKKHRAILDSNIIHLRRPDGKDWDGLLHVNPALKEKGFLSVYNPLPTPIEREIKVPVYYTGLHEKVRVREQGGKAKAYPVDREYHIHLKIRIPARGYNWYILE